MIALSIRQPWAWLLVNGLKDIENRVWHSSFTGPFLIHASMRMSPAEYEACQYFIDKKALGIRLPQAEALQKGGIVGQGVITGCVKSSESPWFTGPYGFTVEQTEPLVFRKCPGKLWFFQIEERI